MSGLYPDEALKAHRDGLIYVHRLDEPDKGYSAGWSITSLADNKRRGDGLKGLLSGILEPLGRLQREWAGPQAVNSLDIYSAAAIKGAEETEHELRENVAGFVSDVQSLRNPLSVSLDLRSDATMPVSMYGFTTSDPQTLGIHMDLFNNAFADALEHSYGRGAFGLVPVLNVTEQTDWGSEALSRYVALSYLYG
ncbi:hypothetical protein KAV47_07740, partial [Candidatus Bathyarchaeota archaeon]|nr:hypothetical protein [Candidatus Bathyarchaeota archaeon]